MSVDAINYLFTSPVFVLVALAAMVTVTFSVMFIVLSWRWNRTTQEKTLVLVAGMTGGGRFMLADKNGGEVSVPDPRSATIRTWPVNELATIDVPYPGVAFVPEFLQKKIRMAIVNEGDWEPMLNRSPHRENIASPDVVSLLESIRDNENTPEDVRGVLAARIAKLATGPTREMIASPAVIGNLLHEKITEAVLAVNKEIIDTLSGLVQRLSEATVRPIVFYICIGIVIIVGLVNTVVGFQTLGIKDEIMRIENALGIQQPVAPPQQGGGGFGGLFGGKK